MITTSRELTKEQKQRLVMCYNALIDKKAEEVMVLDIREISSLADFFMICHGNSTRQVQAISDNIESTLRDNGIKSYIVEGKREGNWILMDLHDIVVHIFHQPTRSYYALDKLWSDAPELEASELASLEVNN